MTAPFNGNSANGTEPLASAIARSAALLLGIRNFLSPRRSTTDFRILAQETKQDEAQRLRHGRGPMTRPWHHLAALALGAASLTSAFAPAADAERLDLLEAGSDLTTINPSPGDTASLELFLDTEGLTVEGYRDGVDIMGGAVSGVSVTHQPIGPAPDRFRTPAVDDAA